jgi:hypothetical protein
VALCHPCYTAAFSLLLLLLLLQGDSHEVSLSKGRSELSAMIDHFVIRPGQDCLEASHRLYRLAVQAGFTKGRMVPQVRLGAAQPGLGARWGAAGRTEAATTALWMVLFTLVAAAAANLAPRTCICTCCNSSMWPGIITHA